MSTLDRVRDLVSPLVADAGLSIYDLEFNKGNLRLTVQGPPGTDLDDLARLSRSISHLLDEEDPVSGRYTLEVSSPGLERPLRRPEHFTGAIGTKVSVKTFPGVDGDRRVRGTLVAADEDGVTVQVDDDVDAPDGASSDLTVRHLAYADIAKATTVFDWGPADRPESPRSRKKAAS